MIFDKLENLGLYLNKKQMEFISPFLDKINGNMKDDYYEIDGDDIYARVMTYNTRKRSEGVIEAHNQYIDIQASISGEEGIDIFERENLEAVEEYNPQTDVIFFKESINPTLSVLNKKGYFSLIYPHEAHRPQIFVDDKFSQVKKFVIKIHIGDF